MSTVQEIFLDLRPTLKSIGASEAAGVMNLSEWETPFSIAAAKKNKMRKVPSEAMALGKFLENAVAQLYEAKERVPLTGDGVTIHVSPFWPWMHATPDRFRSDNNRVVEIKVSGNPDQLAQWGPDGSDQIPLMYKVQCQHQMAVLNCEEMEVAALLLGTQFRTYTIRRDHEFCTQLVNICKHFYDTYIIGDAWPPLNYAHPAELEALSRLTTFNTGKVLQLTPEDDVLVAQYLEARNLEKWQKEKVESLKIKLFGALGLESEGMTPLGHRVKRSVVRRQAYTVNASEYVRLDVIKPR